MPRLITRLFDTFEQAERAVVELERAGVPHDDISIVAHSTGHAAGRDPGVSVALGGVIGAGGGVLAGLGMLTIPGLGAVLAAGWLASAAVGAVFASSDGLVGALTQAGLSREDAEIHAETVRRGGALVSAHVADDLADGAETALSHVDSVNVATRGKYYNSTGWNGLDERAEPCTEASN